MRYSYWITFAIITVLLNVHTKADLALPTNFDLPRDLAGIVSDPYEDSATFRAQCDRLEQAGNVSICVRVLSKLRGPGEREVAVDLFETDRARRTGRLVADEVRARHRSAD